LHLSVCQSENKPPIYERAERPGYDSGQSRHKGKPYIDKLRLHDLRHTCATNLARAGKDIKLIAQYLGHADVKTTARYIHYQDEDLQEAAEILGQSPINSPIRPKVVAAKP
jgi:integrase